MISKLFFKIHDIKGNEWDNRMVVFDPRILEVENMDLLIDVLKGDTKEVRNYVYEEIEDHQSDSEED